MAKKSIKIRAKIKGDVTTVKALMNHPMETGLRKNSKTNKPIPAHFIKEVVAKSGGKTVMTAYWSGGVSKNPYVSFQFTGGKKGDEVTISWTDNTGASDSGSVKIK
jgi:sulfur-oxidizing protein SoxZ